MSDEYSGQDAANDTNLIYKGYIALDAGLHYLRIADEIFSDLDDFSDMVLDLRMARFHAYMAFGIFRKIMKIPTLAQLANDEEADMEVKEGGTGQADQGAD